MFYVMFLNVSLLALLKHNFTQNNQLTTKSHHLRCNVLCNNSSITKPVTVMALAVVSGERQHCDRDWGFILVEEKAIKNCGQEFTSIWVIAQNYQWENLTRSDLGKRCLKHGTHLTPQDTYLGLRESKIPVTNPEAEVSCPERGLIMEQTPRRKWTRPNSEWLTKLLQLHPLRQHRRKMEFAFNLSGN